MKISKEELEMLSPDERAGLEDGRAPGDEQEDGTTLQAKDDPAVDKADDAEDEPAEEIEKVTAKATLKTEAKADAEAEDDDDEDDDGKAAPLIVMPQLKEEAARDWAKEKADLRKLYDDGELSQEEYDDKRDGLTRAEAKAETARDINEASADAAWKAEQGIFFQNYPQFTKETLRAALDIKCSRIDRETKGALSGYKLLQEARKAVNEELGLVPAKGDKAAAEEEEKPVSKTRPIVTKEEATKRAIERAPKTLAEVPSAEDSDASESRFAHLDKLSGMAHENAVARLSPADRAEFEQMNG